MIPFILPIKFHKFSIYRSVILGIFFSKLCPSAKYSTLEKTRAYVPNYIILLCKLCLVEQEVITHKGSCGTN